MVAGFVRLSRGMTAPRDDWYDHPVWYDILHAAGTAREVTGLQRMARRFVRRLPATPRVLEPACGTGRYVRLLAARGWRASGFDLNQRMIDYARATIARRRLRGARAFVADMTDFHVPRGERAHLAFCPINSIRHLPSDRAMLDHLACVRRALAPGGVYAVGIETTIYGGTFPQEDVWSGTRGRVTVRQLISYQPPTRAGRIEHVQTHLTITTPGGERSLQSAYDLRSYDQRQWEQLIERAGWKTLGVCDHDGLDSLRTPRGGVVGGHGVWVIAPK